MDAYRRGDNFLVHLDPRASSRDDRCYGREPGALRQRRGRFEEHQGDEFLVSVRPQGRFSRQFRLGSTIDTENIGASYDGVLTLTLPVSERARPRQIQVGRGGGQQQIGEGGVLTPVPR